MSHDITWERCITVRHDGASVMCAARGALSHKSDSVLVYHSTEEI